MLSENFEPEPLPSSTFSTSSRSTFTLTTLTDEDDTSMGSNSNMIPATQEDKDAFQQGMLSNYSKGMIKDIEPYAYDPIPAVNAKGGRNVDGWRSVFAATVQKGELSSWRFHPQLNLPPHSLGLSSGRTDPLQTGPTASETFTAPPLPGSLMCKLPCFRDQLTAASPRLPSRPSRRTRGGDRRC